MIPENILDQIEADIATYLQGDSWFSQSRLLENGAYVQIPVITEQLGDVSIAIQKAIAQAQPGICIIVQALEWKIQYRNVPGPYIEEINVVLLGIENVPYNRGTSLAPSPTGSLLTIKATMVRCQELLHLWTPPSLSRALVCDDVKLARVGNEKDGDGGIVQYTANVKAAGGTGILAPQVATPTLVNAGGTITLSCTTPGACICYTLNGSFPSPRAGTIYTGPFTVLAGQRLQANAWLTYFTTSSMISQAF